MASTIDSRDRVVTLFGGGGFLGRYASQALLRSRARVRIAQRDPRGAFFLKPLAAVGQLQFVRADIRDAGAVRDAATGSDAVVDLAGLAKGDVGARHVDCAGH